MRALTILRLDQNELVSLPKEIGELEQLEELTFSSNKVAQIPVTISALVQLRVLNMADNSIKHIPQEIGNLVNLVRLFIHGNRFTSFPCSFMNLINLQEFSLEWFMYAKPPRPRMVKRNMNDGKEVFESLNVLCSLLYKYKMNECALITFLENYSENVFDINNVDNRLRTPLHNAAYRGDNGVVEGLLLGKADTSILDKDNCTPLCLAIREENFEGALILINSNVDVNLGGGIYGSPITLAVVKLEIWIVRSLIMKEADVNKADGDGNTPLHMIMNVFSKNPQKCAYIAETLVLNGAKVNAKNKENWSPLHIAARKGQDKGVQTIIRLNNMLLEKGLELFDLNIAGGIQQWTALHLAAHGGHLAILRDLITAGADVFQRTSNNQMPRHCAKGNYMLTKYLKLSEQNKSRLLMSSYQVQGECELISNLQIKPQIDKKLHKNDGDKLVKDYDQFMTSLTTLKISKTVNQISFIQKLNLASPTSVKNQVPITSSFDFTQTMKLSTFGEDKDAKFRKLNLKAEEKKINLFYLKDILIKDQSTTQEKMDAFFKIRKNIKKTVFGLAMRSLLGDFEKIQDGLIQREILFVIGSSMQPILIQPLEELLTNSKISQDLKEEAEEALQQLKISTTKCAQTLQNKNSKHQQFEKSRNVNSFKMKGMGSLCNNMDSSTKSKGTLEDIKGPYQNMQNQNEMNTKTATKMSTQPVRRILGNSNTPVLSQSTDSQAKSVTASLPPKSIVQKAEFMKTSQPKYSKHGSVTLTLQTAEDLRKAFKEPVTELTPQAHSSVTTMMGKTNEFRSQGHRSSLSIPAKK